MTMPDIEELYRKADWPEGEFEPSGSVVYTPGNGFFECRNAMGSEMDKARAAFICEAANYWLHHCRGSVEREAKAQAKREQRAAMPEALRGRFNDDGTPWVDPAGLPDRGTKP
jgi:hypothetical protein